MLKSLLVYFLLLFPFYTIESQANNFSSTICPSIQVCFTPGQNCTMQITDALDMRKKIDFCTGL